MGSLQKQDVPEYLRGANQLETSENTQLFEAASNGDYAKLRDALERGANPNFFHKNEDKAFALHQAARSDSALCAKELVGKGARVDAALISNRNEPIHEAANAGAAEVCKVLIEASPKCAESENAYGNTALNSAARSGSADVVRLLVDRGADPNKVNHRGSTALHLACFLASDGSEDQTGCPDPYLKIAALLICSASVDIDIGDVNGYTPLHIAAQRGCNKMVKLLIDSGASLSARTNIDSKGRGARTPAGMAKFGGKDGTLRILEEADGKEGIVTKQMARELLKSDG